MQETFETESSHKCTDEHGKINSNTENTISPKNTCTDDKWEKYIKTVRDKFNFKKNKLVSNYKFYIKAPFDDMPVAKIKGIKGHPFRDYRKRSCRFTDDYEINISTKVFRKIEKGNRYLDGNIIDAVGSIFERSWLDTKFIWAEQTAFILNYPETIGENWFMLHLNWKMKGKILLPYCSGAHWCLFIVDVEKGTCTHLNPYFDESESKIDERSKICFKNFIKFMNNENQKSKFGVKNKKWTYTVFPANKRPLQSKNDLQNCGCYVLYYMYCLGLGIEFDLNFNPEEFRKEIANLLIENSECMEKTCVYCFGKKESDYFTCSICERMVHAKCLIKHANEEIQFDPITICPRCLKYQYQVLKIIEKDTVKNSCKIITKKTKKEDVKKLRKEFIMKKVEEDKRKRKKIPQIQID